MGTGTRTVQVVDFTPPVIVITDEDVTLQVGQQWNPYDGVVATDNTDGVLQPASSADLPLSGLRLHLDASQLSGLPNQGLVAEWKDSSPLGHDLSQISSVLQPRYNTGLVITDGTLVADSNADYSGTQGKDGWSYGYYEGVPPYNPAEFTTYSGGTGVDAWDGVNQFWTGGEDDQGGTWDSKVVPGGPLDKRWTYIFSSSGSH